MNALTQGFGAEFFKPSMKCRPPHLNSDNLREALFLANVIKRHDLRNDDELLAWMLEKNGELEERTDEEWVAMSPKSSQWKGAVAKARKFGFFLGLDDSWLGKADVDLK